MQQQTTFALIFEGQQISVDYRPDYFSGYDHFEFSSPHQPARPIPVSETGYRSHFAPSYEVGAAPSVEIYAIAILSGLMDSHHLTENDPNQLTLF